MSKIHIYLDDGRVCECQGADSIYGYDKQILDILNTGFRIHTGANDLEWYPPHRIMKLSIIGVR